MATNCQHGAARRALSLEAHGFRRAAIDVLEATLAHEPDAGPLWRLRARLFNRVEPRHRVLMAIQLLRLGKQGDAYSCIKDLMPESLSELACSCCTWKLLRLCVVHGDAERAASLGAQLAQLSSKGRSAQGGEDENQ
jgi:hypothetical protein